MQLYITKLSGGEYASGKKISPSNNYVSSQDDLAKRRNCRGEKFLCAKHIPQPTTCETIE